MSDSLSLTITVACVVVALIALGATATGSFRAARFSPALLVVQAALAVQALLAIVSLLRGHRLAETATFVAYLVVSVLVLPVAAEQTRGTAGRWAGSVLVAAFVVQAVVVVRMQTTWRHA